MSHTTIVKQIPIRDIEALRSAVAELQEQGISCSLEHGENIAPRMYYDRQSEELRGKTEYVLRLPNASFDVGFIRQEDGSYAPVTDFHAGSVANQIGHTCDCPGMKGASNEERALGKLMQLYGKNAAINQAAANGYMIEEMTYNEETGDYEITMQVL